MFTEKGYRRALMTDVAARLEFNHALLYRYVESKEALLELAVRYAMDPAADLDAVVPLATPVPGHVMGLIRSWLAVTTSSELRAALKRGPSGAARAELAGIIDELYDVLEQNRPLLLLLQSLADDYPDLGGTSVDERKRAYVGQVADFLASRAVAGELRPLPDPESAAYFLTESVAWFAQHRKRQPDAAMIDDRQARVSVRQLLLSAFVPDAGTGDEPASD